ncbi:major facilitator super transporter protein [Mortierella sp. GBA43]|nr:major facilitator super transporter protein [Mortierella sp. GBA43]
MFAKGFFPYKAISTSFASLEDLPPLPSLTVPDPISKDHGEKLPVGTVAPRFGKVVLMLIDALRRAIPFTALASAPTVTLPRLKALTTGAVPGFLDAILNIAESDQSSTLANQDNWIAQLARSPSQRTNARKISKDGIKDSAIEGRNIGFFGDDTWIKLFPGLFFRTDGTSSFFAMDTVEVDNNVTRHVAPELTKDDWDGLIFHYLGLDHVGHSGGPKSALMKPKQAEMDAIAEDIYRRLVEGDSRASDQELPTLFILCGDHGMNEVGNHGGSSKSETSTAFLFMSSQFEHQTAQAGIQAMVDPHRHIHDQEGYQYYKTVRQVDLVPTLSLLMGLPIPKNNVGKLIPELFYSHTEFEKLRALQVNTHQVAGVLKNMWSDFEVESATVSKDLHDLSTKGDAAFAEKVDQDLVKCTSDQPQKKRLACLYTVALAGHASFLEMARITTKDTGAGHRLTDQSLTFRAAERAYSQFLEEASSMLSTALSKYDMALLTNGSLVMAFAVAGFIFCAMQTDLLEDFKASCLSPRLHGSTKDINPNALERMPDRNEINWTIARILSVVISILYLVTLFASSFVEEEHQFWYFFGMTWWMVLAFTSGQYVATANPTASTSETEDQSETANEVGPRWCISSSTKAAGLCLLQMAILRLLRGWNQTGQKYADQIDLRHYLNSTWIGTSWILFWITMAATASSLIALVLAVHRPINTQSHQVPAWKTGIVSTLQALLVVVIILASLWITVYKMDLESAYFGDGTMDRIHSWMSMVSSVGYITNEGGLAMSGHEMARGCYAALGATLILASVLKRLAIPTASSVIAETDPMETIQKERITTLFTPSMLLGVVTLLLILLSRRHNAPLFVLFGLQLYLYVNWTTLVRSYKSGPSHLQAEESDGSTVNNGKAADSSNDPTSEAPAHAASSNISGARAAVSQSRFRSLPGQNTIHSSTILLWTLSSFFLFGNSNSIASIDISNAYVGIQAYNIMLTGVLTFVSNWAGPIWWCLASVIIMRWDMELELAWAKQDREARLAVEEERAWKNVGKWKREDKRTLTRRTKKRIMLYKKAEAKSREAAKEQEKEQEPTTTQDDPLVNPDQPMRVEGDGTTITSNGDSAPDCNPDGAPDLQEDLQDGDAFYVYEEQETYTGTVHEAFSTSKPCVLENPSEFRHYLLQTRVLDHLIVTNLFFGMALYILSIAAIILRHHLFIWTVFSPKVLYQFAWTVLFQLVIQVVIVGAGVWTYTAAI